MRIVSISEKTAALIKTKPSTFFIRNFVSFLLMYRFLYYAIILGWKNVEKSPNFGQKSTFFEKNHHKVWKLRINFFLMMLIVENIKFWSRLIILVRIGQLGECVVRECFLKIFKKITFFAYCLHFRENDCSNQNQTRNLFYSKFCEISIDV